MNKLLSTFFLLFFHVSVFAKKIIITGETPGVNLGSIELYLMDNGVPKMINTYNIKNGYFKIDLSLKEKNYYYIISKQITGFVPFIPDKNIVMYIKDKDFNNTIIKGSEETILFNNYNKKAREMGFKWIEVDGQRQLCVKKNDSVCITDLSKKIDSLSKMLAAYNVTTLKENPDSYTALYILSRMYLQIELQDFDFYLKLLKHTLANHTQYLKLKKKYLLLHNTSRGKMAPNFTIEALLGEDSVRLSKFSNKYILLDFWGSWCGPCITSIPKIKALNDKYAANGLRIISLAFDYRRNFYTLLDLIHKYKMSWAHGFINKDEKSNSVIKNYGIISFPTYILIAPDKKILFRDNSNTNFEILEKIINDNVK